MTNETNALTDAIRIRGHLNGLLAAKHNYEMAMLQGNQM